MAPAGKLDELVTSARALTGAATTLVDDLTFSNRAVVARLRLSTGETVVAKRHVSLRAHVTEVEAMRLLPGDTRPALIASGDGTIVMEDLGFGPSLADLLLGDDRSAAQSALHAWAGTLGRALAATLREGATLAPLDLATGLESLVGLARDLAVPAPPGVEADVAMIEGALSTTTPWLAYCPGDTCPDNNRVLGDGSVRLFDFEGAGWRHAATEAAYCRAPFCTCWCLAGLPAGMTASMETEFVTGLRPPRADEFRAAVGLAAVSWTLTTFDYFRRFVIDGRPVGPRGRTPLDGRQYVVLRLGAMEAEADRIPELARLARDVRVAIVIRWPAAGEPPSYPAFR